MKVLNFEDSVYKANAIQKILGNRCGVASVEQVSNVEDGLKMLKDAENAGEPFNLIITDMHFPMRSGAISDTEVFTCIDSDESMSCILNSYEVSRNTGEIHLTVKHAGTGGERNR